MIAVVRPWVRPAGLIAIVTGAAVVANYVGPASATVLRSLAGLLVVAAVVYGALHHGRSSRGGWLLVALGIGGFVIGDALWDVFDTANFAETSYWYDVVNVIYLTMYPVIFVGLFRIASPQGRHRGIDAVIDSAVLALSGVLLLQVFVINPRSGQHSTVDWFTALYPYGDALLLAAVGWLTFTQARRSPAAWLLGTGIVVLIVVDTVWEMTLRYAVTNWDAWINPGYPIAYGVIGAAVLHPSAAGSSVDGMAARPTGLHHTRLAFLCTALVLIPIAAFLGAGDDILVKTLISALVAAIAIRLVALVRAVQSAQERFVNLARAMPVGVFVADENRIVTFANEAANAYAGGRAVGMQSDQLIAIADERDQPALRQALSAVLAGETTALHFRVHGADGSMHWIAWAGVPERSRFGKVTGAIVSTSDVTAIKTAEEMHRANATHDALTGLPNRRLVFDRLQTAITRLDRQPGMLAVLFLDLDNFKPVNDSYGHDAGDELLTVIARRMRGTVRAVDTVARFGGDEFLVILERVTDRVYAAHVAQKLLQAISFPVELTTGHAETGTWAQVSACVGIATTTDAKAVPDQLIHDADTALYQAKAAGDGLIRFAADVSVTA